MSRRPKRKAVTSAEVRAKRARGETDLRDGLRWGTVGEVTKNVHPLLLLLQSEALPSARRVAGFDLDFTVIRTASGRKFSTGLKDWTFWDPQVLLKLQKLHEDDYRVIFFTNQAGIEKQKVKPQVIMEKIEDIIKALGIPVLVFVSTGNSNFRKPSTMMWDYFVENCNKGTKVDMLQSFYVGDAAGRPKNWAPGKPKDFSCSDRMFAANIGLKFYTPEEYFLGQPECTNFSWNSLDPNSFLSTAPRGTAHKDHTLKGKQELVVMVGPPASGKSTFCRRHLKGYVVVNRDSMGTMEKCLKAAREALSEGKSVVCDNTNPTKYNRAKFIEIAKKKGTICRCFHMATSLELAHHLNYFRQNQTNGKIRRIPDVGYNVFKKNFETPCSDEGFDKIVTVDFEVCFDSVTDEKLFRQWTN